LREWSRWLATVANVSHALGRLAEGIKIAALPALPDQISAGVDDFANEATGYPENSASLKPRQAVCNALFA
jgi:hypothetical protein